MLWHVSISSKFQCVYQQTCATTITWYSWMTLHYILAPIQHLLSQILKNSSKISQTFGPLLFKKMRVVFCHHLLSETQFAQKFSNDFWNEWYIDPRTACAFGEDLQLKLERVLNLENAHPKRIRFGPLIDPIRIKSLDIGKKHDPIVTHGKTPHPCIFWSSTRPLEGSIMILPRRISASFFVDII